MCLQRDNYSESQLSGYRCVVITMYRKEERHWITDENKILLKSKPLVVTVREMKT